MSLQVEEQQATSTPFKPIRSRRGIVIAGVVILGVLAVVAVIYVRQWPFTRQAVAQSLQQQTGSSVQITKFRQTYFPRPGCVAQGLTFYHGSNAGTPLITIQTLTVTGSYSGLLTRHIDSVRAEGLHITIPPQDTQTSAGTSSPVKVATLSSGLSIGQIIADGAQLDFPQADKGYPTLVFRISKLILRDLKANQPFTFQSTIRIPQPEATVVVAGKFGPWQAGNAGQTPLSGSYTVSDLDLHVFDGIAGVLTGKGSFGGVLQHELVEGTTDTPDFEVTHSGHPVAVATRYYAVVNGLDGDVDLNPVIAHFDKTTIICTGSIAGDGKQPGKIATLQLYSNQARIQDLLRLFVTDKYPPMSGPIQFRAKVILPPDDGGFLDRVRLQGDFGISGGRYPNPDTQKNIDVLSARAQGKADQVEDKQDKPGNENYDPGRVLSKVKGHVVLAHAVARLSDVAFDVPGASAHVDGTYKLKTEQIDFQGRMTLDTQLSKATTGVKSFLLKVIQPLTASKKHKSESVVSLKIGGTYEHPSYMVLPIAKK